LKTQCCLGPPAGQGARMDLSGEWSFRSGPRHCGQSAASADEARARQSRANEDGECFIEWWGAGRRRAAREKANVTARAQRTERRPLNTPKARNGARWSTEHAENAEAEPFRNAARFLPRISRMTRMRKRAFSLPELPGLLFGTRLIGVSEQLREGTTTYGHEGTRMRMGRCSRGHQPRTMPTMRPPKAIPNHPEFTADVADGADRWSRNETAGTRGPKVGAPRKTRNARG
jgi:hypothetical protein